MGSLVTLTCPSCSGKLQITPEIDRFACGYCGTEFAVNRGAGIVSLSPVVEGLKRVERGVDKTASELAIARLDRDIGVLSNELNRLKAKSIFGLFKLSLASFFLAFLATGFHSPGYAWLFMIAGVVILVAAFVVNFNRGRKKMEIREQIAGKRAEITRHEAVIGL
jgi:uncharacterized small protein (DUF1192 family)